MDGIHFEGLYCQKFFLQKYHLDSVISITPVIKLGKAKSLLYRDVPDPAIALQELLYVPGGDNS